MKKIMYIFIIASLGLSFNINASTAEGKWYQFTSDFIQNCFDGFETTQEGVNETYGKTSSFANSLTRKDLADCLPNSPYLDTDAQVDSVDLGTSRSCQGGYIVAEKMNLPSASDGQTVALTSTDGKVVAKYKCNNGNWGSSFDKVDVAASESSCSSVCYKWDSDGVLTTCASASEVTGNANVCGTVLPSINNAKVLRINAASHQQEGTAIFTCNNGYWELVGVPTCAAQTCSNDKNVGQGNLVFWSDYEAVAVSDNGTLSGESESESEAGESFDSNIEEEESERETLSALRTELSILSASGRDTSSVVNEILSLSSGQELSATTSSLPSATTSSMSFEENSELRERKQCSARITGSNGLSENVVFHSPDARVFKTRAEAEDNHKIVRGEAIFSCYKGQWVPNAAATCRRDTSANCNNTRVVSLEDGDNVLGYYCE